MIIISTPHQDALDQINYHHLPSSVPKCYSFPFHSLSQNIPYNSSLVNLSLFQVLSPMIPNHQNNIIYWIFRQKQHQNTLYHINYCHYPSSKPILVHFPSPPLQIRPWNSSSADLISVQLLSPITPHHQSKVYFVIINYIYWLLCQPHIRIPNININIFTCHHQCLYLFIFLNHINHIIPYYSSSEDLIAVQLLSPIIPHQ